MKSIKEWQQIIHRNAITKGFWHYVYQYDAVNEIIDIKNEKLLGLKIEDYNIPERLSLIHSEISEALECYRNRYDNIFRVEMADTVIRIFDLCEALDIDLEKEIEKKYKYNLNRAYMHGNKRC
ncbi:unnamed protein product [marine sediment metagenome]|uniref:Uncharacterized protein n=1 Tax=marine sediment metagenome TaxID=412755 RepID=X0U6V8_9ZZZZ